MKNNVIYILFIVGCLLLGRAIKSLAEPPVLWGSAGGTFEASPAGTDLVSAGDDKIREMKQTVRDYGEAELCWSANDSTGCSIPDSGLLRQGAARAFFQTSAPPQLSGSTAIGAARTLDNGRLWADSDSSTDGGVTTPRDNKLRVYDAAWEEANGVPDADRNAWYAAANGLTTHLLAVRATLSGTSDTSGANCASPLAVAWNTESFDDSTLHDTASNNNRLLTPSGATRVRVHANIVSATSGAAAIFGYVIRDNAATIIARSNPYNNFGAVSTPPTFVIETGPVTVTGGTTWFEVFPNTTACLNADGTLEVVQNTSWFSLEVIK